MTDGASQIFPMLSPSVLKHLRSNGCPSSPSCHNAPNTTARWANSLTGSAESTSHLIPTIWAHSDAIDVGRCQRELLRPVPCIHHAFGVVWNTLKAMDVPPPYYVTIHHLSYSKGRPTWLGGSGQNKRQLIPTIWAHSDASDVVRCQRKHLRPV